MRAVPWTMSWGCRRGQGQDGKWRPLLQTVSAWEAAAAAVVVVAANDVVVAAADDVRKDEVMVVDERKERERTGERGPSWAIEDKNFVGDWKEMRQRFERNCLGLHDHRDRDRIPR